MLIKVKAKSSVCKQSSSIEHCQFSSFAIMIFVIFASCVLLLLIYWHFMILANKETGFINLLFCPETKTVDGSKLSDIVKISKHESLVKNSLDIINLNPGKYRF